MDNVSSFNKPNFYHNDSKKQPDLTKDVKWAFLFLLLIPIITIFGNILVGVSVYLEKRLQNRFNYFLVSLAVSDFLCAILVMPVSTVKMVHVDLTNGWPHQLCLAWYSLDVFFTATTIIHLCTISIDRYVALNNPLRFHQTKRKYSLFIKISISWLIPFGIACPLFLSSLKIETMNQEESSFKGCGPNNAIFIMTAVIVTFILPLLIMMISYILTVKTIRKQTKNLDSFSTNGHRKSRFSQSEIYKKSMPSTSLTTSILNVNSKVCDDLNHSLNQEKLSLLSISTDFSRRSLMSCNNFPTTPSKIQENIDGDKETYFDFRGKFSRLSRQMSIPFRKNTLRLHRNSSVNSERLRLCANVLLNSRLSVNSRRIATSDLSLRYIQKSRKAVQVLGIVFGLFVCCYMPFFVIYLTDFFCVSCKSITSWMISYSEWIGYSASMMNPVVYHIFNPTFRRTFNRLIRCRCYKVSNFQRSGSFLS
uniref:GCR037 n=1 Tax=Schmidtea mediterranea TaxID=79327 RepID=A0A193KUM1_SCHMD|nr:GCR037 [Schmidtea mediterranea]